MAKYLIFLIKLTIMIIYVLLSQQSAVLCNFIVFGEGRSGSNLLNSLLNQNKQVQMHGEIFNWGSKYNLLMMSNLRGFDKIQFNSTSVRQALMPSDVNGLMQLAFSDNNKNATQVGFKVFPRQMSAELLFQLLEPALQLKNIILWRSNILETYVSLQLALSGSSSWRVYANKTGILSGRLSHDKVNINPDLFYSFKSQLKKFYLQITTTFNQLNTPYLIVEYNSDLNSGDAILRKTIQKVFIFLGVKQFDEVFNIPLMKQSNYTNVADSISNWVNLPHEVRIYNDSRNYPHKLQQFVELM